MALKRVLALPLLLLCLMLTCRGQQTVVNSKLFNSEISHIMSYKNSIYVVDGERISKLSGNLELLKNSSTCGDNTPACNNTMKIFLINNLTEQIITCGTGNDGVCQIRNLSNFGHVVTTSDKATRMISKDATRPAAGVLTNEKLLIAVTYGNGIKIDNNNDRFMYSHALSTKDVKTLEHGIGLRLNVSTEKYVQDYLIYFSSVLKEGSFTYFTTNQKRFVGEFEYVSKLIRLCDSDLTPNGQRKTFHSYVDIEITCEMNSEQFNLIQDALIVTSLDSLFFIGLFVQGSPQNVSGNTAVCFSTIYDISESIEEAQKMFANCSEPELNNERYFSKQWTSCKVLPNYTCDDVMSYQSFNYILGVRPLKMTWLATLDSTAVGYGNKLYVRNIQDGGKSKSLDLHIGTSIGKIVKMNWMTGIQDKPVDQYEDMTVHNGFPIVNIFEDFGHMFVATKNKVIRYQETNCSEFLTCAETMKGRNPLCGWCVYQGRSTRQEICTESNSQWISSLDECIPLLLNPKGQYVNDTEKKVTLTASNLTNRHTDDLFMCVYKDKEDTAIKSYPATENSSSFLCDTPNGRGHGNVTVELKVTRSNRTVTIASAKFLYYNCTEYTKCSDCTTRDWVECGWCPSTKLCQHITDCTNKISNSTECPWLYSITPPYIPSGQQNGINITGKNLDTNEEYKLGLEGGEEVLCNARDHQHLSCTLKPKTVLEKKKSYKVRVNYASSRTTEVDSTNLEVTMYNCTVLGTDCSHCLAINSSRYSCKWKDGTCVYNAVSDADVTCPGPTLTRVTPEDGSYKGGTKITIEGTNLGSSLDDIKSISVVNESCKKSEDLEDFNPTDTEDYKFAVPRKIVCTTSELKEGRWTSLIDVAGNITVQVLSQSETVYNIYTYKVANLSTISPKSGPISGGTLVTFSGTNLGIGSRTDVVVRYNNALEFSKCVVLGVKSESVIQCFSPETDQDMKTAGLNMNGIRVSNVNIIFEKLDDPVVESIIPLIGTLSGGTSITVNGDNLANANRATVTLQYGQKTTQSDCDTLVKKTMVCRVPEATEQLKKDVIDNNNSQAKSRRRKRDDCSGCAEVKLVLSLDGVKYEFMLKYFVDPSFNKFGGEYEVFNSDEQRLVLTGTNLNLVANDRDFNVTIGLETCAVVSLTEDQLECLAPKDQPDPGIHGSMYPEVNVTLGNYHTTVGFLKYESDNPLQTIYIISAAVGGSLLAIIVIGVILGVWKYKQLGKKSSELNDRLYNMEMEIKQVAKEEFFHMHNTMSGVNKNLVEQGFPYHNYQQYAFNTMFPTDYMDNHPLLHEPVVSDDMRFRMKKGMETFEQLILNRFFLVSVLSTMEQQKKFFLKEKSNLAGNLCAILLGRMEYLQEVLGVLLTNLVADSTGKRTQKTLFRRCESITEKLLHNWLFLCQYPHIKTSFGSPLYLMYKAMQLTIESGPIDAVTGAAYYTLTEDGLLRKWNNLGEEGTNDPQLEAKPLTLNVVVDNNQEMFPCKVLDCDTITQVKRKCMTQIYVNFPASQLEVEPEELHLEWHEGFGGSLNLQDEDNTSLRDSEWVRLNTLAHYTVKDMSNMALIDPRATDFNQENYVNLAQITVDDDGGCNGSMDSNEPLTLSDDPENPQVLQKWHLVKPETEASKQQKSLIAELYLPRLFTTKQCIMEYFRPLFDILLSKRTCPPTTQYLYNFLDELAEKNKVDADTVHLWKSHSYIIRVWASLIKSPGIVFDLDVPEYVESSMEVLGQVLIDSCSLTPQKHTKDSPPQKLIFMSEVNQYSDKVREFYNEVEATSQSPEELRVYLADVNKLQNQTTQFNKMSALYRLYQQMEPYFEDIIEDLSMNKEASSLQLDKKFEQVIQSMEAED